MQAQIRAGVMTGSDTIANTATVRLLAKVTTASDVATFQLVNEKLSGTAAGKTYFEGSLDGTNYIKLDSFTNVNVTTNTKFFTDNPSKYIWYRLSSTGVGTMSVITKGYYILRKT